MGQTIYYIKRIDISQEITDTNVHQYPVEVYKYDKDVYDAWHVDPANENNTLDLSTISTKIDDLQAESLSLELSDIVYESVYIPSIILISNNINVQYSNATDRYRTYTELSLKNTTDNEVITTQTLIFNQNILPLEFHNPNDESIEFRLNDINFEIPITLKENKTITTYGSTFSYSILLSDNRFTAQVVDNTKLQINNYDNVIANFELTLNIISNKIPIVQSKKYLINFLAPLTRDIYTLRNNEVLLKSDIQTEELKEIIVKQIDNSKDYLLYLKS